MGCHTPQKRAKQVQFITQVRNSYTVIHKEGFPGGSVVKNVPVKAGDTGLIPDPEDPTSLKATKPEHHSYEPGSRNYSWAQVLQPLKHLPGNPCSATREATTMRSPSTATTVQATASPCSLQLEKSLHGNEDPA